jgi:hypothetical protein
MATAIRYVLHARVRDQATAERLASWTRKKRSDLWTDVRVEQAGRGGLWLVTAESAQAQKGRAS